MRIKWLLLRRGKWGYLAFVLAWAIAQLHGQAWVSPAVWQSLAEKGKAEVLIVHRDTSFSLPRGYLTKEERGRMVYEVLHSRAERVCRATEALLTAKGVSHRRYWIVPLVVAEVDAELLREIAALPQVQEVVLDRAWRVARVQVHRDLMEWRDTVIVPWGIRHIGVDEVWRMGYRGQGVRIGGQDTGYDWDVPALKERYAGYMGDTVIHDYHWHDAVREANPLNADSLNPCGFGLRYPCDDHGHGTHTMGTMVGALPDAKIGVAPEARWIGCRNMDRGWGKPSTYIECFEWFVAPTDRNGLHPDPTLAPHVINNSWACPEQEGCRSEVFPIMRGVVERVRMAGIVPVVSAGNSGQGGCGSVRWPAAIYDAAYTVGALGPNDSIAPFSSKGPVLSDSSGRIKPDITAPGVEVLSQLPDSSLQKWSGTSMAGPHVAGVVALMISANPRLAGQVDTIEAILNRTAIPHYAPGDSCTTPSNAVPNNVYGYGVIDAVRAVQEALRWRSVHTDQTEQRPCASTFRSHDGGIAIDFEQASSMRSLRVYDLTGRLRWQTGQLDKGTYLRLKSLPPGAYILQWKQGSQWCTRKLVTLY